MNDYIDVIKKTIQLSSTLKDGIEYIREGLIFKEYDEVEKVIEDTITAVVVIEKALNPVLLEIKGEKIKKSLEDLRKNLNSLEESFNAGNTDESFNIIQRKLFPMYNVLEDSLNRDLKKYTYC
ncbi:hypothetical protein FDF74_01505 [Clostridium niameyense]|uniref:DUF8042 domain-containing protein n=1 Tax=Clostridium niameyense TaxID=1622073 RepID=A0A6M0R6V8_9CLOT|nr:hypothetical protein [Clostridium niameyense]NEZ45883.1 hypothetical protein [Clostridium niameyense]